MDTSEQSGDVPNTGGGRPYVVFKDRRYLGGQTRKITKTLPRAVLDQMVTDALASCPPSAGSSVRSLSFKYDLRKDRWVKTTFMMQIGQAASMGVVFAVSLVGLTGAVILSVKLIQALAQTL